MTYEEIARAVREMNSAAHDLFEELEDKLGEEFFDDRQRELRNSIVQSFSKLDYVLKLMEQSHRNVIARHGKQISETYEGLDLDFVGQTEVHAESFYSEAFRLKKRLEGFPRITNLELLPLTLIRNRIVEHPKVDKSAMAWSGTWGTRLFVGGAIDPKRPKIEDKGFYPNVFEFYTELHAALKKAISAEQDDE